MQINATNYRSFPAVSNSDLGWLEGYWTPKEQVVDLQKAYANGTLIDAMITEPAKVNYFSKTVEGEPYQYSAEEFHRAEEMKKAFYRDAFCAQLVRQCSFQHISYRPQFRITHNDMEFCIPAKGKWDLLVPGYDMGGDIKSTVCTTQKQFEESIRFFNYDRQGAYYLNLEDRSNFIFIGISKVNFKIFKVPFKRGDELFKAGVAKYEELAFRWALFFEDTASVFLNNQPSVLIAHHDESVNATIVSGE